MGKKDKTTPSPVLGSKGMIAGIIIIAVIILTVVVIFATGNAGGSAVFHRMNAVRRSFHT